jgi:hypothetical protein
MARRGWLVFMLFVAGAAMAARCPPQADGASAMSPSGGGCDWRPPKTSRQETVSTVGELRAALKRLKPDTTILLRPGVYQLPETIQITVPHVVMRGADRDRSKVTIRGLGMTDDPVGVAIAVSAADVTIADLTIGWVRRHGVQVRGEHSASRVVLHNLHIVDTGQQLVKGSLALDGRNHADAGLLECSLIEYTDHAPSDYTNGIDVIGARGWTVRDNEFRRIRGPLLAGWQAGPAILFWGNSIDTIVERNLIVESFRGIAFGIGPGGTRYRRDGEFRYDHQGGVIRNNVVVNVHPWADEGIEANAARGVRIDHNTVFVEGRLSWSVSVRFAETSAQVRHNLTNRAILVRDHGYGELDDNIVDARREWFVDPARSNLRLTRGDIPGVMGTDVESLLVNEREDFDRTPRSSGTRHDAGAFEYRGQDQGQSR